MEGPVTGIREVWLNDRDWAQCRPAALKPVNDRFPRTLTFPPSIVMA
jgi:hypothetical protein